ncbi:hypothetical protein CFOL_v3_27383, partial [Cephalotus follicularis]
IIEYLKNLSKRIERKIKILALNYYLYNGELYRKGQDGLLLRCMGFEESMQVMMEVHEETCRAHQSGLTMHWLIRRHGCFSPTITTNCINYARGYRACQRHGNI